MSSLRAAIPHFDYMFLSSVAESGLGFVRLYSGEILHGYSDWRKTYYAPHFETHSKDFGALNIREEAFGAAFDALISYHYENANTLMKSHYLPRGGVALDVGVRAGHWIVKASRFGASVIGIDATDFAERYASLHIEANGLHNCRFIREAVSSKDGEKRTFFAGSSGQSQSGFYAATRGVAGAAWSEDHTETYEVQTRSIDSIVSDLKKLDLIVLEINGAEREALSGARATLRRLKPKLYVTSYNVITGGNQFAEIASDLEPLGYRLSVADDTTGVFSAT